MRTSTEAASGLSMDAVEMELVLESRDAAFDLELRENGGQLATLYRRHVRCGGVVWCACTVIGVFAKGMLPSPCFG